ncbi:unnamed protein product [Cyprideis torosa]|uniref:Uncharacterized protein n=1 Tax=Cyprideis torosa TaxID=163714 RepID=A0A7R8ZY71_9CRUS|nr:unnamed protein product [Cyprideis torosa]CAG0907926.1 unnamed protein product [Cyprideis torosa]
MFPGSVSVKLCRGAFGDRIVLFTVLGRDGGPVGSIYLFLDEDLENCEPFNHASVVLPSTCSRESLEYQHWKRFQQRKGWRNTYELVSSLIKNVLITGGD